MQADHTNIICKDSYFIHLFSVKSLVGESGWKRSLAAALRHRSRQRSMETTLPLAPPGEAVHGTVTCRSQHTLHPSERQHNCCRKTTLQGDTDMKTGMHGLSPPPPTVPPDLHVTGATNESEASLAHATPDATGAAFDTSLQGAHAMRSGTCHRERTAAIAMIVAVYPQPRTRCKRAQRLLRPAASRHPPRRGTCIPAFRSWPT